MAKRDEDRLFYGVGAIVLLALGFGGVFLGWGKPLARFLVNHALTSTGHEKLPDSKPKR
jgi:hypothetical protein